MRNKALFVIYSMNIGGAQKSLISFLSIVDREQCDIDLLVLDGKGELIHNVPNNVNVIKKREYVSLFSNDLKTVLSHFSFKGLFLRIVWFALKNKYKKDSKTFYSFCQKKWQFFLKKRLTPFKKKYDYAIAYMQSFPTYFVMDKVCANKKVLWLHNDYSKLNADTNIDFEYYKSSDINITISDYCKDIFNSFFPSLCDKTDVIPNFTIEKTLIELSNKYYPSEFSNNALKILSIGRLENQKGFDLAIEAASILKKKIKFVWIILGEGSLKKDLKEQIKKNGLEKTVLLLGTRKNPYVYIKNCDLFVQSSRYEGKSIVLDEAKTLNKIIISTNYTTVTEQITDKKNGYICDIDPNDIAQKILEVSRADNFTVREYLKKETEKHIDYQIYLAKVFN